MAFDLAMLDDARTCLNAGAQIILLEAAELVSADADTAREVEEVVEQVGGKRVMFELPGSWIAGVTFSDIHRLRAQLIDRFGPQVNLANVSPGDLIFLEAYHRRLGVNAGGG